MCRATMADPAALPAVVVRKIEDDAAPAAEPEHLGGRDLEPVDAETRPRDVLVGRVGDGVPEVSVNHDDATWTEGVDRRRLVRRLVAAREGGDRGRRRRPPEHGDRQLRTLTQREGSTVPSGAGTTGLSPERLAPHTVPPDTSQAPPGACVVPVHGVSTARRMALALDDSTPAGRRRPAGTSHATRRGDPHGSAAASDARVEALRRVVAEVSANLQLDKVFEDVLDSSQTLFGAEVAGLWLFNPGRHPYELVAHRDLDPAMIAAVAKITADAPVIGNRAVAERRPIVLEDPSRAPNFAEIYTRLGYRTVNFVPLIFRDEPVGLLVLYHRAPYDWTPDELALCTAFAAQMATAVANARLFNTVREGAARLRAIQELSSRLNRIQDVTGIGEAIVAEADRLIAHDTIRVYAIDEAAGMCEPIAFHGEFAGIGTPTADMLRVAIGEGLTGWVAQHNRSIRLGDAAIGPARPPGRRAARRGVDAHRPDVLRDAGPGRHRPVQGGLRPVRRGRRADARDLRQLRGPGARQRRGVRAGPPPAAGAPPPAREPAPPARGQRAAARHARPVRRAGDDRRQPQDGRDLRLAHDLPRRPRRVGPPGRRRPRPVRRR